MKPVDVFHIGPQKAGTTWVYECLREHPGVGLPPKDSIHYLDIHYARGRDWYASHFANAAADSVLIDPTPSYLRSPYAPARAAHENAQARIIVCLRHPIERAFSHYWHEKRQRRFDYAFDEIFDNYDLWSNWLESGFYSRLLERWLAQFPRDQVMIQVFDDLHASPRAFLDAILSFVGLDIGFEPSVLNRRVNAAKAPEPRAKTGAKRLLDRAGLLDVAIAAKGKLRSTGFLGDGPGPVERLADVDRSIVDRLQEACAAEYDRLEGVAGIDLSRWRQTELGTRPSP